MTQQLMELLRKKFAFGLISLFTVTLVTLVRGFDGGTYVALITVVVPGFLVTQAYVDGKNKKEE